MPTGDRRLATGEWRVETGDGDALLVSTLLERKGDSGYCLKPMLSAPLRWGGLGHLPYLVVANQATARLGGGAQVLYWPCPLSINRTDTLCLSSTCACFIETRIRTSAARCARRRDCAGSTLIQANYFGQSS